MNILPNKNSFPYQSRLEFVLDFLLDRMDETDRKGMVIKLNLDSNTLDFKVNGIQASFPLNDDWLVENNVVRRPEGHLEILDGNWWETVFFYLTMTDRKVHRVYDEHGRWVAPEADQFWPNRSEPFLDQAKEKFWNQVSEKTETSFSFEGNYTPILSVDVDQWYAYRYKPLLRNLGGLARDIFQGQFARAWDRVRVVVGIGEDPYDRLEYMQTKAFESGVAFEAFILPPVKSKFDKQVSISNSVLKAKLDSLTNIGLHPSYYVHGNSQLLRHQKNWLENVSKRPIHALRYHFIRGKHGEAEAQAIEVGFETNTSLVLTHRYGFPNGTCHPFPYWDHESNSPTELIMIPQIAMDVSLKDYCNLDPTTAIEVLASLIHYCKQYGGVASIIWHNSSFNPHEGWTGYDSVFENTLATMSAKNNA